MNAYVARAQATQCQISSTCFAKVERIQEYSKYFEELKLPKFHRKIQQIIVAYRSISCDSFHALPPRQTISRLFECFLVLWTEAESRRGDSGNLLRVRAFGVFRPFSDTTTPCSQKIYWNLINFPEARLHFWWQKVGKRSCLMLRHSPGTVAIHPYDDWIILICWILPYLSLIMITICTMLRYVVSILMFVLLIIFIVVATFGSAPRCSLYQLVKSFQNDKGCLNRW